MPPWARLEHLTGFEKFVDMLARARCSPIQPVDFGRGRPAGLLLRLCDAGEVGTVTISRSPEGSDGDLTSFELAPEKNRKWWASFARAPFPEVSLEPGRYFVRADRMPCVYWGNPGNGEDLLLALDPAEEAPVTVIETSPGDLITTWRSRWYRPARSGYVADDGVVLTREQVNELRSRVLSSRPEPGESVPEIFAKPEAYLASLGITDDVIAGRLATIRQACVSDGWKDADGNAPEIPPELDELFTLETLKEHMAEYLLRAPGDNWSVTCELPGDPWIYLCTSSEGPDLVSWFVAIEGERWYALDRGLASAMVDLSPADGWMRAKLEENRNWRERVWSTPWVWGDIPKRVDEALTQVGFQRLPGWAGLEERFQLESVSARSTPEPRLPSATLAVTRPGTIDVVFLRPDWNDDEDWTDVVSAYERAERAAGKQPWLARWKRENVGRIGVYFPLRIDHLERRASAATEAWEEAGIGGTPAILLSFSVSSGMCTPEGRPTSMGCGLGVLSEEGDLLILESRTRYGPLASELPREPGIEPTRYGVVRPGAAPEIRTREK